MPIEEICTSSRNLHSSRWAAEIKDVHRYSYLLIYWIIRCTQNWSWSNNMVWMYNHKDPFSFRLFTFLSPMILAMNTSWCKMPMFQRWLIIYQSCQAITIHCTCIMCSTSKGVLECPLMVQRVVGSIPPGGAIELFLIPTSALQLGVHKVMVCAILSVEWCNTIHQ